MAAYYRPYRVDDITALAATMSEADKTEVYLSDGVDPFTALQESCATSCETNTIVSEDSEVLGMFGLYLVDDMVASPWMLTSGKLSTISTQFLRESRNWIRASNEHRPILCNYVHAENDLAIKWLRFLDCKFIRLIDNYGVGNAPFYEFIRIRNV